MMLVASLVAFGLLEILLLVVAGLVIAVLVTTFGRAGRDTVSARCPACGARLERVDNGLVSARGLKRDRVYRCGGCASAFREGRDGRLYPLPFDVPGDDDYS